ncbi:hypothetical protein AXF42_Ash021541 [Apostasia shenzhenica]|uniref:Uncharacterized protein n=1 Tax=Apostasia shenzhenica TaxID=1088818 RepID=A0A2H9ZUA7_9ASPA|nr:hypothetical protein AXF42_Ash021541 [Apostasia shenzhenica]
MDLRWAMRFPLKALALSTVAPASPGSPLYGHPVSVTTISTAGKLAAFSADLMASSCASNIFV